MDAIGDRARAEAGRRRLPRPHVAYERPHQLQAERVHAHAEAGLDRPDLPARREAVLVERERAADGGAEHVEAPFAAPAEMAGEEVQSHPESAHPTAEAAHARERIEDLAEPRRRRPGRRRRVYRLADVHRRLAGHREQPAAGGRLAQGLEDVAEL